MIENLKKVAVGAGLCAVALLSLGAADRPPYTYIEEVYEVQDGDTLEGIGKMFMEKNTYGAREISEFTEGIREANPWLLAREAVAGDKLTICYWVKKVVFLTKKEAQAMADKLNAVLEAGIDG